MSQVCAYVAGGAKPANVNDAVIGNGGSVPTITGTNNVALTFDPATVTLSQLQKAAQLLADWTAQYCNSANAAGSTYCPTPVPV